MARPRTLLIDSKQLESDEALDDNFRAMAGPEIAQFRRDMIERRGDQRKETSDKELLPEVMNTVGEKGRLRESIRCEVSVSMLTENWDANNVAHVLGVRAFGTAKASDAFQAQLPLECCHARRSNLIGHLVGLDHLGAPVISKYRILDGN